jgi:hypothetical protein
MAFRIAGGNRDKVPPTNSYTQLFSILLILPEPRLSITICSALNRFFGISKLLCQAHSLTTLGPRKPGQVTIELLNCRILVASDHQASATAGNYSIEVSRQRGRRLGTWRMIVAVLEKSGV